MEQLKNIFFGLCIIFVVNNISADNNTTTEQNFNFTSIKENKNISDSHSLNIALLDIHNSEVNKSKSITQREIVQNSKTIELPKSNDDVRLFLPPDISIILEAMESLQDEICKEHVFLTLQALNRREKWALQMLDSSAKFPSSVLTGSYYQMGNYDECVSIQLLEDNQDVPRIKGQYCLAEVYPHDVLNSRDFQKKISRNENNSTLHWAICVPHSCKPKEVSLILDFVLNGAIGSSDAVSVNVTQRMCYYKNDIGYTSQELAYGYVIVVIVCLISLSTFYHVVMHYHKKDDKMPNSTITDVILSFSVIYNVKKMLSVGGNNELNLNCICGIKFLSMLLIISAHSLLFLSIGPVINDDFFKEATQKVENGIFINNPLLVDTYLLISGFLFCRLVLRELEKRKGRVNFILLYIFRYIRLTPVYLVIIGFYCTWLVRLDEGPLWESRITLERDRCINSWWLNILYVNNYIDVQQMCMFQSWYLAVDTQLFMLAPLIIYPLWKWKKIGNFLLGFSIVITVLIPFSLTYFQKLDPTLMLYVPEIRDLAYNPYFINAYIKTHMRASSYCIGLFFGYLVHKLQLSSYKLPRISIIICWLLSGIFTISAMYSVIIFYEPSYEYNALEAGLYSALHRVIWCLGIGWILFACITNHAGPVAKFLCWKPFIPLSRLTFCAYLANGIIELHSYATVRTPRYMSTYQLGCDCLSHLILTFALAFVLCILFESPIVGLEKLLLKREKRPSSNTVSTEA